MDKNMIKDGKGKFKAPVGDYYFEHNDNAHHSIPEGIIGSDKIVATYSTITSAIHIAAYMGAKNIILVGHDCAKIDGKLYLDGYYTEKEIKAQERHFKGSEDRHKCKLFDGFDQTSVKLKEALQRTYRCNIHSLNPFINFKFEGKKISYSL